MYGTVNVHDFSVTQEEEIIHLKELCTAHMDKTVDKLR